jgi:hypothetical protein
MEKNQNAISQRKKSNAVIICDMIRLQISLRTILTRLDALPRPKAYPAASAVPVRR